MELLKIHWYLNNVRQDSTITFQPRGNMFYAQAECIMHGKYWLDRYITLDEYNYIKNYVLSHDGDMTKFDKM